MVPRACSAAPALAQAERRSDIGEIRAGLGGNRYEKFTTRAMKGTVELPDDNVTGSALVVAKAPRSFA